MKRKEEGKRKKGRRSGEAPPICRFPLFEIPE